jgi:hypothetical protein
LSATKAPAKISIRVTNVVAKKLDEKADQSTQCAFNLNVNMDEAERKSEYLTVNFVIGIDTEPAVVKFQIDGSATIQGDTADVDALTAPDPQTNVPHLFMKVYQHVYAVVFMLAGALEVPYPSPALLRKTHIQTASSG